jgi:hypothetical protein
MTAFDGAEVISESIRLTMKLPGGETSSVHGSNVFYVRGAFNLFSQGQLFTKGIRFELVLVTMFMMLMVKLTRVLGVDMLFPLETEHVD